MVQLLIQALDKLEDGDWDGAHRIAQDYDGQSAAWLHAHLHRVKGDEATAREWYDKAGREPFEGDTTEERYALRQELTSGVEGMMGQNPGPETGGA
ncbi:hypothetical protein [Palleronia sp.]|uniref:hypothetical protein n=1 Tax=Palleronia sp. TaxID=1940284 RepID=UPI0035C79CAB